MTSVEMHSESFCDWLELLPESFSQDAGVSFAVDNFSSKNFGSHTDDLVNLLQ